MKSVFVFLCFLLFVNNSFSQPKIIGKYRGELVIMNIHGQVLEKVMELNYHSFSLKERDDDSLTIFLTNNGYTKDTCIYIQGLRRKVVYPTIIDHLAIFQPRRDLITLKDIITKYSWDTIQLNSVFALKIECYLSDSLFWTKRYHYNKIGPFIPFDVGYQNPILSPDRKSFLFTYVKGNFFFFNYRKTRIIEIDITSGKTYTIARSSHGGSYSPDGNYILYMKRLRWKDLYFLYNRATKKRSKLGAIDNAFWFD